MRGRQAEQKLKYAENQMKEKRSISIKLFTSPSINSGPVKMMA